MKKIWGVMVVFFIIISSQTNSYAITVDTLIENIRLEGSQTKINHLELEKAKMELEEVIMNAELQLEGWLPEDDYKARTAKIIQPFLAEAELDLIIQNIKYSDLYSKYDIYELNLLLELEKAGIQSIEAAIAIKKEYELRFMAIASSSYEDQLEIKRLHYEIQLMEYDLVETQGTYMILLDEFELLTKQELFTNEDVEFNYIDIQLDFKDDYVMVGLEENPSMNYLKAKNEAALLTYEIALSSYAPSEPQAISDELKMMTAKLAYEKAVEEYENSATKLFNDYRVEGLKTDLAKSYFELLQKSHEIYTLLYELNKITVSEYNEERLALMNAEYLYNKSIILLEQSKFRIVEFLQMEL